MSLTLKIILIYFVVFGKKHRLGIDKRILSKKISFLKSLIILYQFLSLNVVVKTTHFDINLKSLPRLHAIPNNNCIDFPV